MPLSPISQAETFNTLWARIRVYSEVPGVNYLPLSGILIFAGKTRVMRAILSECIVGNFSWSMPYAWALCEALSSWGCSLCLPFFSHHPTWVYEDNDHPSFWFLPIIQGMQLCFAGMQRILQWLPQEHWKMPTLSSMWDSTVNRGMLASATDIAYHQLGPNCAWDPPIGRVRD